MKELAEALKPLITKLSDFLDILDLSFLISGSVTFGALLFALWSSDASTAIRKAHRPPTVTKFFT